MTIAVAYKGSLFTDKIGVDNGFVAIRRKSFTLADGTVFAMAGLMPSLEMVNAQSQQCLLNAYADRGHWLAGSTLLSIGPMGVVESNWDSKGGYAYHGYNSECEFVCIGAYQSEFANYVSVQRKENEGQGIDFLTRRFICELTGIWGYHTLDVAFTKATYVPPSESSAMQGDMTLNGKTVG